MPPRRTPSGQLPESPRRCPPRPRPPRVELHVSRATRDRGRGGDRTRSRPAAGGPAGPDRDAIADRPERTRAAGGLHGLTRNRHRFTAPAERVHPVVPTGHVAGRSQDRHHAGQGQRTASDPARRTGQPRPAAEAPEEAEEVVGRGDWEPAGVGEDRGPCRARRRRRARGGSPCRAARRVESSRCRRPRGVREPDDRGHRNRLRSSGRQNRSTAASGSSSRRERALGTRSVQVDGAAAPAGAAGSRRSPEFVQGVDEPHASSSVRLIRLTARTRTPVAGPRSGAAATSPPGGRRRRQHDGGARSRHPGDPGPRRQDPDDDDEARTPRTIAPTPVSHQYATRGRRGRRPRPGRRVPTYTVRAEDEQPDDRPGPVAAGDRRRRSRVSSRRHRPDGTGDAPRCSSRPPVGAAARGRASRATSASVVRAPSTT